MEIRGFRKPPRRTGVLAAVARAAGVEGRYRAAYEAECAIAAAAGEQRGECRPLPFSLLAPSSRGQVPVEHVE